MFVAYHLVSEGVGVTIIEQGEPGSWSRAAAGLIEYRTFNINRINAPGYIIRYLGMVRRGEASIRYLRTDWLVKYLRNYGRGIPSDLIEGIKEINDYSRRFYRSLSEELNDFEYSEEPYYELTSDIESAIRDAGKDPLNPKFEVVEFMGREAIAFYDTAKLSTDLLVNRLLRELEGRVRFVRALALGIEGSKVLLSSGKTITGDAVIVTAGYWSSTLGIPVMPFRGFGIRVRPSAKLNAAVSFEDLGIFAIPFSNWVKVTAGFEPDPSIDTGPVMEILRRARSVFGELELIDVAIGYRPCTPDGLPIIDRVGENTYVATGGCRLGWTQAPGVAKLVTDLTLGRTKETKFKVARFN